MIFKKRIFDILFSSIFLILFTPFFLLIPILIKLDSSGPVFFKSLRVGQYGKEFNMFKFRTMFVGTKIEETKKIKNVNKKITKIGFFLRKSSLDELPQFLNVLIGQMSIVGPRPALITQKFIIKKRSYFKINNLKPGITGLAQINGRDSISEKKKIYFDKLYYTQYNIFLDIKILLKTIVLVFHNKDISH